MAINFWPHIQKSRFALLPEMFFYEFIPLERASDDEPETVFMDEVRWYTDKLIDWLEGQIGQSQLKHLNEWINVGVFGLCL